MRRVDEFLEPGSRVRVENNPSINYQAKPDGEYYPKTKWCLVIMSSVLVSTLHIYLWVILSYFCKYLAIFRKFSKNQIPNPIKTSCIRNRNVYASFHTFENLYNNLNQKKNYSSSFSSCTEIKSWAQIQQYSGKYIF